MLQRATLVARVKSQRSEPPVAAGEPFPHLTSREREIADLIALGARNKEIAVRLAITERTVKSHLTNIFQKLGFTSRLQLAIYTLSGEVPTRTNVQ